MKSATGLSLVLVFFWSSCGPPSLGHRLSYEVGYDMATKSDHVQASKLDFMAAKAGHFYIGDDLKKGAFLDGWEDFTSGNPKRFEGSMDEFLRILGDATDPSRPLTR